MDRRLKGFVLCSIAAHAGLLAMLGQSPTTEVRPSGRALSVALISNSTDTHSQNSNPVPAVTAAAQQSPSLPTNQATPTEVPVSEKSLEHSDNNRSLPTNYPTAEKRQTPRPGDTTVASAVKTVSATRQTADKMSFLLKAALINHFNYPLMARRHDWQGEVRVSLRIEPNGQLSNIHVIKSSGYTILDRAAINSLQQLASLPDAGNWLHGQHFDTVLPIEYRLIDS